jgi:hypothetical protein
MVSCGRASGEVGRERHARGVEHQNTDLETRRVRLVEWQPGQFKTVRYGDPNGIRTRVATLKGWSPRPLDDGVAWKA